MIEPTDSSNDPIQTPITPGIPEDHLNDANPGNLPKDSILAPTNSPSPEPLLAKQTTEAPAAKSANPLPAHTIYNDHRTLPISPRQRKAYNLVRKGYGKREAMAKAGYKPTYIAEGGGCKSRLGLTKLLQRAEEQFYQSLLKGNQKNGFTGELVSNRLMKTITGRNDFNSTHAIKEMGRLMFRRSDKNSSINIHAENVVIPALHCSDWSNKAVSYQQEVEEQVNG
jgi:hypothetical protein